MAFTTMAAVDDGSSNDIFDSLPYYDDDLQKFPHLHQKVAQELARELKKVNQTVLHPKVPPPVELFAVREHCFALLCCFSIFILAQG